jgi:hypothetical protein
MGFQILDGKGRGYSAEVSDSNKLLVSAVISTQEHYANHNQGRGYYLPFSATPTGAGDCFLYVKNSDSTRALSIEGMWLKSEADDYIDLKLNDEGTPVGGTDITPVNMNTASGRLADGTFQSGNDITGLSGGSTFLRLYHANTKGSVYTNFDMDVILGANGVLTMYVGTGTTALAGTLSLNFHGTNN